MRIRAGIPLIAVVLGACGEAGGTGDWAGRMRDSAGVVLVENPEVGDSSAGAPWRARVELVVGGDESRPETLFGHIADLAVDAAGRIYVLDAHAQAVRIFDSDGGTIGSLGGPGEGPGELGRFASSVVVRGDTVLIVDWGQARLSRFSRDGTFLASERMPAEGATRTWWSSAAGGLYFRSLSRYTDEAGRWRGRDLLLRYAPGGAPDTILVFDYAQSDVGGRDVPNVPLIVNAPSWTVLSDGRVAWLALEEGRVRIHGPDGALRRIVSSEGWRPRPPTAAENALLVRKLGEKLEMLGGSAETVDRMPVERPERLPAVTAIEAGPDGTIWVQRMGDVEDVHPMSVNSPDPPTGLGGSVWDVLDAEGRSRGRVELRPGLRVLRITDDAVYGVRRDALDQERVVRLGLEASGGG